MTRTLWATLAATLFVATAARAATCTLQQIGELPIALEQGELVVDASINGTAVKMTIDTGADGTFLSRAMADHLGLRMKPIAGVTVYGVGGGDTLSEVGVRELKVGGLVAKNIDLAVTGHEKLGRVAGYLGAGFLFQSDVEFDLPNGKLRFFKALGCAGDQVVYWGKAYAVLSNVSPDPDLEIQLDVKLAGTVVRAKLDSGAGASFVDPQAAARLANHDIAPESSAPAIGMGKESVATSIAVFPSFAFGDETINNARLRVGDLFHADREVPLGSRLASHVMVEPQMILGADFFRAHRIYVSKNQRKVYVSYMGGPVFDTRVAPTPPAKPAP